MRKQKGIFELFRESQYKLNETPSRRIWHQLEHRLDQRYHREDTPMHYYIATIAGILAIVTVIALLFIMIEQKREGYLPAHAERVAVPFTTSNGRVITFSDFDWIEGTWESEAGAPSSYEEWEKQGNRFIGKGYVVNGKDTLFAEKMEIEEQADRFYFKINLEADQRPAMYQLTKQVGNRLIFTNEYARFPKQVIFELQSPDEFSIQLSNPHPLSLNENQLNYLTRRNKISTQQITRHLQKVIIQ